MTKNIPSGGLALPAPQICNGDVGKVILAKIMAFLADMDGEKEDAMQFIV